jgi:hypothetical protein
MPSHMVKILVRQALILEPGAAAAFTARDGARYSGMVRGKRRSMTTIVPKPKPTEDVSRIDQRKQKRPNRGFSWQAQTLRPILEVNRYPPRQTHQAFSAGDRGRDQSAGFRFAWPGRDDDEVVGASFVRRIYAENTPQKRSPPDYPLPSRHVLGSAACDDVAVKLY